MLRYSLSATKTPNWLFATDFSVFLENAAGELHSALQPHMLGPHASALWLSPSHAWTRARRSCIAGRPERADGGLVGRAQTETRRAQCVEHGRLELDASTRARVGRARVRPGSGLDARPVFLSSFLV